MFLKAASSGWTISVSSTAVLRCPTGGHLEQADGTAWMALFSQNMLELAVELAAHDRSYEDMVFKFAEHFYFIAAAMNRTGDDGMWDEEDGFYYDLLRLPDGSASGSKCAQWWDCCLCAPRRLSRQWQRESIPMQWLWLMNVCGRIPELKETIHPTGPGHLGRSRSWNPGPGESGKAAADPYEDAR